MLVLIMPGSISCSSIILALIILIVALLLRTIAHNKPKSKYVLRMNKNSFSNYYKHIEEFEKYQQDGISKLHTSS